MSKIENNKKMEKNTNLKAALSQIEKQFGSGAIMRLGAGTKVEVPVIPTGALSLDIALGIGGIPRGRVTEIFGPESSGKTTLALHVVANAQKAGGMAAFIDAEHALDPNYAKKLGVKIEDLLISQPSCGEEALEIAEILVKNYAVDVIVVDSVAALVPRAELDGTMGDSQIGLQARLMSHALRKLTAVVHKSNTTVIFINQLREKIGAAPFSSPETTTGGRALKFYASIRIDIRKGSSISNGNNEYIGTLVRAKVVKNKLAPPFRTAEFEIIFNEGISYIADVINLAVMCKIIEKRGSWFSFGNLQLGQGKENVKAYLRENPEVFSKIEKAVKQRFGLLKEKENK